MLKSCIIAGVVMLTCVSITSAATISDSAPFGPTAAASAPYDVMLDQFDPAMGQLISVTLKLDANTFGGTINWDNEGNIPTNVSLGIGAQVTATAPSALAVVVLPLQLGAAQGISADNDGAPDFIGTDSFSVTGGSGSDSDNSVLLSNFAPYLGLGQFATTISSEVQNLLVTTGGFGPMQQTPGNFDGVATVIYEYVPEPASFSLLAIGALAITRRRN